VRCPHCQRSQSDLVRFDRMFMYYCFYHLDCPLKRGTCLAKRHVFGAVGSTGSRGCINRTAGPAGAVPERAAALARGSWVGMVVRARLSPCEPVRKRSEDRRVEVVDGAVLPSGEAVSTSGLGTRVRIHDLVCGWLDCFASAGGCPAF